MIKHGRAWAPGAIHISGSCCIHACHVLHAECAVRDSCGKCGRSHLRCDNAGLDGCFIQCHLSTLQGVGGRHDSEKQRNLGYSVQSLLINVGAVIGSALPFILTAMGVNNQAAEGEVPASVIWSFYIGGSLLLLSVLVTVFRTKEYPPKEFREYNNISEEDKTPHESFLHC